MKQPYNTALYMRLSRDDENYGDSISIETQRTILRQFAKENGFHVVDEYVDDGWSGTSFDRPDFQRMMDDAEAGKINCIITKDLSRFGREHVMMDYYLEFLFPEKHIRYIAVAENEDTEKGLSDFVPFKNLFNEWYAKDTSRKVKAAQKAKFLAGEIVFTHAPLGYKRSPDTPNALVIDEETRWIVEKIFDLAVHGSGARHIASVLTEEGIPTPGWMNYKRYGTFSHLYEGRDDYPGVWSIKEVKKILTSETYIGNTIHYKQTKVSYKSKKHVRNPPEKWVRIENTHEAIVSKDVFDRVQEQIDNRRRSQRNGTPQIFAGLLKCADCGRAMHYTGICRDSTLYRFYNCGTYKAYGKHGSCTSHHIRYEILYTYVLSRIRHWAWQAMQGEDQLLDHLLETGDKEREAAAKKQTAELKKAERRKAEVDRAFAKMYEDWAEERITEYNFNMLSQKYQAEQEELDKKIRELQAALSAKQESVENAKKWISLIREIGAPAELTAEMLNTLIEKILIHESTEGEFGGRDQEIEIIYRFVGKID